MNRICKCCNQAKDESLFPVGKKKYAKDGALLRVTLMHTCRQCKNARDGERQKRLYAQEPERMREINKRAHLKKVSAKAETKKRLGVEPHMLGKFTEISIIKCPACGNARLYPKRKADDLKTDYCHTCYNKIASIGRKNKVVQCQCPKCGIMHDAPKRNSKCNGCKREDDRRWRRVARSKARPMTNRLRKLRIKHGRRIEEDKGISRSKIYKRDGYQCYLCAVHVVESKTWKDNMATLDHVVPLALGGAHTYDNIRTCCAMCNSIKRDLPLDEAVKRLHDRGRLQSPKGFSRTSPPLLIARKVQPVIF